jgi:xyloglucan-specific exo-beta-1,4-glucanase
MAGCIAGWSLVGGGSGREVEITSGDGCPPALVTCSVPDAAPFADESPGSTPAATPTGASASPTATPSPAGTTTTAARAATRRPAPAPARRATASRPAPRRAAASLPVVEYSFRSQWDTGYVVVLRLTNTSRATWNGWSLSFRLGAGSTITSSWNTQLSGRTGLLRARDDGWNAVLAPGEGADFGMEGTGAFRASGCVLNGQPCQFQPGGDTGRGRGHRRW